MAILAVFNL